MWKPCNEFHPDGEFLVSLTHVWFCTRRWAMCGRLFVQGRSVHAFQCAWRPVEDTFDQHQRQGPVIFIRILITRVPLVKRHSCVIASEFHTVCCQTGELEILDAGPGISLCRSKVGRGIGSSAASELVRSQAAGEGIVAAFARQGVVAAFAPQDVPAISAEQLIMARAAFQFIVIAATTNHIVAASGGDLIPAVDADDHVCTGGAIEPACVRLAIIRSTNDDALIVDVDGGCLAVAHRGSWGRHELEGPNVAGRALRTRGAKLIGGWAANVGTRVNGRAAG